MDEKELKTYVQENYPRENESCEWKGFTNLKGKVTGDKGDDIASYISAIANVNGGHLVVGVEDKTLNIIGIRKFAGYTKENICERLIGFCAHLNSEDFRVEEIVTDDTKKTIWIFHIPKHRPRLPVHAHGHPFQRIGDSLVRMLPERLSAIVEESIEYFDWSAQAIEGAAISDLDEEALKVARDKFKERNVSKPWHDDIDGWNWETFLDKAQLTAGGVPTRATLLLLGKPTSVHLLSPHPAQITWNLADEEAYEHFGPPFLLTTTHLLRRIRNHPQKLFPKNQLLAVEIQKYDSRVILEALHNCLAHQDYERQSRIIVTEKLDRLIFENAGSFFEGNAEEYFKGAHRPNRYRNLFLANAMVQINMIDTMGYGLRTMMRLQRSRYLPLPDYSKSTERSVTLEVLGRPIDENYSQLLFQRQDLDVDHVILLDRIQKRLPITDKAAKLLRQEGLIEGRKPHYHVSAQIASATNAEVAYTRTRGVEKQQLKQMVLSHLNKFKNVVRPDLDGLLLPMLSGDLTHEQKQNKITNLLSEMKRKDQSIQSVGRGPGAYWSLSAENAKA